jgi:DNA polymerase III epsilon subunit family exonuclease
MVALIVLGFLCLALIVFLVRGHNASDSTSQIDLSGTAHARATHAPPPLSEVRDFSILPREFIVLDLETTGLNPELHEIIEFGAIRANRDSDTHSCFQSFVKPKKKIPRRITELTGITQASVDAEGRALEEVFPEFLAFIGDLPLVTFNAAFDMRFLQKAASQHGITITNRYTCALKMARRAWPGLPSYRLPELAKLGNLSNEDAHRAVGDCRRTLIIFVAAASKHGKRINWIRLKSEPLTAHSE